MADPARPVLKLRRRRCAVLATVNEHVVQPLVRFFDDVKREGSQQLDYVEKSDSRKRRAHDDDYGHGPQSKSRKRRTHDDYGNGPQRKSRKRVIHPMPSRKAKLEGLPKPTPPKSRLSSAVDVIKDRVVAPIFGYFKDVKEYGKRKRLVRDAYNGEEPQEGSRKRVKCQASSPKAVMPTIPKLRRLSTKRVPRIRLRDQSVTLTTTTKDRSSIDSAIGMAASPSPRAAEVQHPAHAKGTHTRLEHDAKEKVSEWKDGNPKNTQDTTQNLGDIPAATPISVAKEPSNVAKAQSTTVGAEIADRPKDGLNAAKKQFLSSSRGKYTHLGDYNGGNLLKLKKDFLHHDGITTDQFRGVITKATEPVEKAAEKDGDERCHEERYRISKDGKQDVAAVPPPLSQEPIVAMEGEANITPEAELAPKVNDTPEDEKVSKDDGAPENGLFPNADIAAEQHSQFQADIMTEIQSPSKADRIPEDEPPFQANGTHEDEIMSNAGITQDDQSATKSGVTPDQELSNEVSDVPQIDDGAGRGDMDGVEYHALRDESPVREPIEVEQTPPLAPFHPIIGGYQPQLPTALQPNYHGGFTLGLQAYTATSTTPLDQSFQDTSEWTPPLQPINAVPLFESQAGPHQSMVDLVCGPHEQRSQDGPVLREQVPQFGYEGAEGVITSVQEVEAERVQPGLLQWNASVEMASPVYIPTSPPQANTHQPFMMPSSISNDGMRQEALTHPSSLGLAQDIAQNGPRDWDQDDEMGRPIDPGTMPSEGMNEPPNLSMGDPLPYDGGKEEGTSRHEMEEQAEEFLPRIPTVFGEPARFERNAPKGSTATNEQMKERLSEIKRLMHLNRRQDAVADILGGFTLQPQTVSSAANEGNPEPPQHSPRQQGISKTQPAAAQPKSPEAPVHSNGRVEGQSETAQPAPDREMDELSSVFDVLNAPHKAIGRATARMFDDDDEEAFIEAALKAGQQGEQAEDSESDGGISQRGTRASGPSPEPIPDNEERCEEWEEML